MLLFVPMEPGSGNNGMLYTRSRASLRPNADILLSMLPYVASNTTKVKKKSRHTSL